MRDEGFTFPDCDRPPEWCVRHDVLAWLFGGPTDWTARLNSARTLRSLACRRGALVEEVALLDAQIDRLVTRAAPEQLALPHVGPQVAAALLVAAGDNPGLKRYIAREIYHVLCAQQLNSPPQVA